MSCQCHSLVFKAVIFLADCFTCEVSNISFIVSLNTIWYPYYDFGKAFLHRFSWHWTSLVKVVGSIDQTGVADDVKSERDLESVSDSKNGIRSFDSDKTKAKRKLYVGSQALGYRRDHMEVRLRTLLCWFFDGNDWNRFMDCFFK